MLDEDFKTAVLERLVRIETKLNNGINYVQEDHEKRIRSLEKSKWILMGIFIILEMVIITLVKLFPGG